MIKKENGRKEGKERERGGRREEEENDEQR